MKCGVKTTFGLFIVHFPQNIDLEVLPRWHVNMINCVYCVWHMVEIHRIKGCSCGWHLMWFLHENRNNTKKNSNLNHHEYNDPYIQLGQSVLNFSFSFNEQAFPRDLWYLGHVQILEHPIGLWSPLMQSNTSMIMCWWLPIANTVMSC